MCKRWGDLDTKPNWNVGNFKCSTAERKNVLCNCPTKAKTGYRSDDRNLFAFKHKTDLMNTKDFAPIGLICSTIFVVWVCGKRTKKKKI